MEGDQHRGKGGGGGRGEIRWDDSSQRLAPEIASMTTVHGLPMAQGDNTAWPSDVVRLSTWRCTVLDEPLFHVQDAIYDSHVKSVCKSDSNIPTHYTAALTERV